MGRDRLSNVAPGTHGPNQLQEPQTQKGTPPALSSPKTSGPRTSDETERWGQFVGPTDSSRRSPEPDSPTGQGMGGPNLILGQQITSGREANERPDHLQLVSPTGESFSVPVVQLQPHQYAFDNPHETQYSGHVSLSQYLKINLDGRELFGKIAARHRYDETDFAFKQGNETAWDRHNKRDLLFPRESTSRSESRNSTWIRRLHPTFQPSASCQGEGGSLRWNESFPRGS